METVIARIHHPLRSLDEVERAIVAAGAADARVTGFTVALMFDVDTHGEAEKQARKVLHRAGAEHIKVASKKVKIG
jgi:hypothetical protein